jgi:hypothetical protein
MPRLPLSYDAHFKIVFEMKWFETGTPDFAGQQLVKYLYQAFFHRALPYVPLMERLRASIFDAFLRVMQQTAELRERFGTSLTAK